MEDAGGEMLTKWGPFGQKKKFMEGHPGATDGEWEKYDRVQGEKKKGVACGKARRADVED
jgi:hypothetical protein